MRKRAGGKQGGPAKVWKVGWPNGRRRKETTAPFRQLWQNLHRSARQRGRQSEKVSEERFLPLQFNDALRIVRICFISHSHSISAPAIGATSY